MVPLSLILFKKEMRHVMMIEIAQIIKDLHIELVMIRDEENVC